MDNTKPLTPADMARRAHDSLKKKSGTDHWRLMGIKSGEARRAKKELQNASK